MTVYFSGLARAIFVCGGLLLTGCSSAFQVPDKPLATLPAPTKVNCRVGLLLTDEFSNYQWQSERGASFSLALGAALSSNGEAVAKTVFQDVVVLRGDQAIPAGLDAIVAPRVASVQRSVAPVSWEPVDMSINLEWTVKDSQGKIIWINTIKGNGKAAQGDLFSFKAQCLEQARLAMQDLFAKSCNELAASPEIKALGKK